MQMMASSDAPPISALIFDVDDTLYPITNGFTAHRLQDVAIKFMVEELGFADEAEARVVREHYFDRCNSMMKALTVAASEGAFPHHADGTPRAFDGEALAAFWVSHCRFGDFIARDDALAEVLISLKEVQTWKKKKWW